MRYFVAAAILMAGPALAEGASIGHDCKPSGIVAIASEKLDPGGFWAEQIIEIPQEVKKARYAHKAHIEQSRIDRMEDIAMEREMRALGIPQARDPMIDQTDRMLNQMSLQNVRDTERWAERCMTHAKRKLSESR